jgi:hypothetical protein
MEWDAAALEAFICGKCAVNRSEDNDQYSPEESAKRLKRRFPGGFSSPPQPHGKNPKSSLPPKRKERPASKGCVHKGRTQD